MARTDSCSPARTRRLLLSGLHGASPAVQAVPLLWCHRSCRLSPAVAFFYEARHCRSLSTASTTTDRMWCINAPVLHAPADLADFHCIELPTVHAQTLLYDKQPGWVPSSIRFKIPPDFLSLQAASFWFIKRLPKHLCKLLLFSLPSLQPHLPLGYGQQ